MTPVAIERIVAALKHAGLLADVTGTLPENVADITDDSRQVVANGLFLAVRGSARDGHEFLAQAEAAGAVAAIVEDVGRTTLPSIVVREGRRAAAIAAAAAFDDPAKKLQLVAVTGTNGKTTVVGILRHLLDKPDARSASHRYARHPPRQRGRAAGRRRVAHHAGARRAAARAACARRSRRAHGGDGALLA